MEKNILQSSLQDASLNMISQVLFRILTFLMNSYVARHVSQDTIGVMYIRLLLLESTILFLSREAFRKACSSKTVTQNWRKVINLAWLTVPLCLIFSVVFGFIWLNILVSPEKSVTRFYKFGVYSIIISCIIEMCAEPLYQISRLLLFVKLRVYSDSISIFLRTFTFVALISYSTDPVLAFSLAQIFSVLIHASCFYSYFKHYTQLGNTDFPFQKLRDFFPKYSTNDEQIDYKVLALVWSFLKQGFMMQILTEGEKYIMTLLNVLTFAEQGIFDIVNNLGSLAARFLFRPLEDSFSLYFSQLIERDKKIKDQEKVTMDDTAFVLEFLLRCVSSLGLVVLCFGQNYAKMVLFFYGGQSLISGVGPILMRAHCLSIFLMAVNGITECFLQSTISATEFNKHNKKMVLFSLIYLLLSVVLSYLLGSVGFILANCCNMCIRVIHSVTYIQQRYSNSGYDPINGLYPKIAFIAVLIISFLVTKFSDVYWFDNFLMRHFFMGVVFFSITVITWLYLERENILLCWKTKRE